MSYGWGGGPGGVDESGQAFAFLPTLPFLPEFHEKVRDGRKTATARSKAYGKPGDRLQGPGCVLILDSVEQKTLGVVAAAWFPEEGLRSPGEFILVWNRIHPRKRFEESTVVWFHRFHVEPSAPEGGAKHD